MIANTIILTGAITLSQESPDTILLPNMDLQSSLKPKVAGKLENGTGKNWEMLEKFTIIGNDGSVFHVGFVMENARINQTIEGSLSDPQHHLDHHGGCHKQHSKLR